MSTLKKGEQIYFESFMTSDFRNGTVICSFEKLDHTFYFVDMKDYSPIVVEDTEIVSQEKFKAYEDINILSDSIKNLEDRIRNKRSQLLNMD